MIKSMRRSSLLIVVLACGALAPADPAAADPKRAVALAQLKVIELARTELDQRIQAGVTTPFDGEKYALWSRRKVDALRASGAGKAEMIAALESYRNDLKRQEQLATRIFETGQGPHSAVYEMQYRVLEADLWLNQEKAR